MELIVSITYEFIKKSQQLTYIVIRVDFDHHKLTIMVRIIIFHVNKH